MPYNNIIRAALKAQTSFCHSKYLSITQSPMPKGLENLPTEAALFANSFNFWTIIEKFSHGDAARQKRKR